MKNRSKFLFGFAMLAGAGTVAGVSTHGFARSAFASDAPNASKAASEALAARNAIAKRKAAQAVQHAERAVANDPQNADYRALLGQAYLLSGRFVSATQALNDALTLNPEDGGVALNLILAKIAGGDWPGARATLQKHADRIPASDRGLALALAGDPVAGVEVLMPAARAADANAKTRQNLALALALAGRWQEARALAAVDVAPDQLDARIMEWAQFSRPTNAYDQVASLLGVRAVEDGGQPLRLALAQQAGVMVAAATPASDPVEADISGSVPALESAVRAAAVEAQPEARQIAGTGPQIVFGPRAEIVQQVPVARREARSAPGIALVRANPAKARDGNYYVQLGAYANAAVARDAWARHTRRVAALAEATPQGARLATRAGNFYRLSVGGFARSDADALCRQVRGGGGTCFVRVQAGDAVAEWAKRGTAQVAAR